MYRSYTDFFDPDWHVGHARQTWTPQGNIFSHYSEAADEFTVVFCFNTWIEKNKLSSSKSGSYYHQVYFFIPCRRFVNSQMFARPSKGAWVCLTAGRYPEVHSPNMLFRKTCPRTPCQTHPNIRMLVLPRLCIPRSSPYFLVSLSYSRLSRHQPSFLVKVCVFSWDLNSSWRWDTYIRHCFTMFYGFCNHS